MGWLAIFMMVTAVLVMIPVLLQIRMRETRAEQVWGLIVFAAGLLVVGLADTTVGRPHFTAVFVVGLLVAITGLVLQARRRTYEHKTGA